MSATSTSPSASTAGPINKETQQVDHVERVETHDSIPGNEKYNEKTGFRTYGDGEDHDHEPPVSS